MKKLYSLIISCFAIAPLSSYAVDQCDYGHSYATFEESLAMRNQHLIVLHHSVQEAPRQETIKNLNDFIKEFCKMPFVHRKAIFEKEVEIHLLIGSIAQHPVIESLIERGITPRNHVKGWAELPGVAGTASRLNPAGSVPVIINIASLYENHGSKNLVLHEMAHTLDYFLFKDEAGYNKISSTQVFTSIMEISPFQEIYLDIEPQELLQVPERPTLDLTIYKDEPASIRAVYEQQARSVYENQTTNYNRIIETNITIRENNAKLALDMEALVAYHQQEEEEHFAEMYARWYAGPDERYALFEVFPELNNYFPNLEHK